MGYQQSGVKDFKIADPIHHKYLFELAEKNIKEIESDEKNFKKYKSLLKLFDKANIINEINTQKNHFGEEVPAEIMKLEASSKDMSK